MRALFRLAAVAVAIAIGAALVVLSVTGGLASGLHAVGDGSAAIPTRTSEP